MIVSGFPDPVFLEQISRRVSNLPEGRLLHAESPQRIVMFAPLNATTACGQQAINFVQHFLGMGIGVRCRGYLLEDGHAPIPPRVRECIVPNLPLPDSHEFIFWPPHHALTPGKRTIYFTMWESTKVPKAIVERLNKTECVIVPSRWCETVFSASGVDAPIRICPLGMNTDIYRERPLPDTKTFIFGTSGKFSDGGQHKRINLVAKAFKAAFPTEQDVRLKVKCFSPCRLSSQDPRVEFTDDVLTEHRMAAWYESIHCFVNGSSGEGFGLMPLQAMGCGRPVIGAKYSGVTEYFNEHTGLVVNHTYSRAWGFYEGQGHLADLDFDHLVEQMRAARSMDMSELADASVMSASRFTLKASAQRLASILSEFGVIA